ncbi:MAG TPA: hypothetical protein VNN80_03160, partial [Polyangiaceae bacterium]|nr:hypothetical protein [Polyangiaceae bacterium]
MLLWSNRGAAQSATTEAEKPAPNVLLLVDSSGSMEFQTDGTFPECKPGETSEKSRWIDLLEVLTGSFEGYSCWAQPRDTADFETEFELEVTSPTRSPYDFGYVNPYHRPLSDMCAPAPGVLPPSSSPQSWPTGYLGEFSVRDRGGGSYYVDRTSACTVRQGNGLLDTYGGLVRFGLMTFDALPNAGTGLSGTTSSASADYTTGTEGNWSYYVGSPTMGRPEGCDFDTEQEVGARNAAAPPWEGRMVAFGPWDGNADTERNQRIQDVLLATRPYGATPIAGQLDDARSFLFNDDRDDPLDTSNAFGPRGDKNWQAANCRKTILILLTDGEPNLDLRPYCGTTSSDACPYQLPRDIVRSMREAQGRTADDNPPSTNQTVETYVIGFALEKVRPKDVDEDISCDELTDEQCAADVNNVPDEERSRKIQACCT